MIRRSLILMLAITGLTTVAQPATASHPWPNPDYGYIYTWQTLYPNGSRDLTWKAWTIDATAVPTRDALILINVVDQTWEPMFNYALASGGEELWSFIGKPYNQSANAKYARMNNSSQVRWFCGASAAACFVLDGQTYDSALGRWVATEASLVYGPHVINDPTAEFAKHVSHEWGHGFGLAHEGAAPPCVTVMTQGECTNQPIAAEIATALDTVYGY